MFALVSNYNQNGYKIGEVVETFDQYNCQYPQAKYKLIKFDCKKGDILGSDGFGRYWVMK